MRPQTHSLPAGDWSLIAIFLWIFYLQIRRTTHLVAVQICLRYATCTPYVLWLGKPSLVLPAMLDLDLNQIYTQVQKPSVSMTKCHIYINLHKDPYVPVRMHRGATPPMHFLKESNTHLKVDVVSSPSKQNPNIVHCRGFLYTFVLCVVSNVSTSPKSAYSPCWLACD